MRSMFKLLLTIPILFCTSCIAWAQLPGVITGIVLDETGAPVEGATISVYRTDIIVVHWDPDSSKSTPDGKFTISSLSPGSYEVFASKKDAGYPDTFATFYKRGPVPSVTLTSLLPQQSVIVHLAKAATLILPPVKDKQTHKDISVSAVIALCRTDLAKACLRASATQTHFLVPLDSAIQVEISALGYKPFMTVLQPKAGESLSVSAELEPVSSNAMLSDLLMRLGRENDVFFTLEEASEPVDEVNPMGAYRPALPSEKDLASVLEHLRHVVPHFSYEINPQNPHIIHIVDDRLIGQEAYGLGQQIDHLKFSGRGTEFVSAVCMRQPRMYWGETPGPFDLADVDLKTDLNINLDKTQRRDALSLISTADGHGGVLWMARTDIGANKSTFLTFCCAPRLK